MTIADSQSAAYVALRDRDATLSLANPRLYAFALVLAVVPLWLGEYLPLVDLPGHLAIITALKEFLAGNAAFTSEFAVEWYAPYLTGLGLVYALSLILPITVAAKIVVSLSIILIPIATGALLREIGADERWKWLVIPGTYSVAFYWGFLSYLVAIPIGIWLLVQTIRFDRAPSLRGGLGIAAIALLAFFSHLVAMGFACLCALAYIAGARYTDLRGLALRALPYTAPLPLIALWFARETGSVVAQDAPYVYGSLTDRFLLLISQSAGLDSVTPLAAVLTIAIVILPPLCGARLSPRPERWLPFVVGLMAFFAAPAFAFLTGFFYERLGAFLVPLWLMLWNSPRERSRLEWIAMPLVLLWVAANTWRFASFGHETRSFDAVAARMEPGKRVAAFVVDNTTSWFSTPVYLHFVSWYQAKTGGVVDFNFGDFQSVLLRSNVGAPHVTEVLAWRPWFFEWTRHGGSRYDYFVVKSEADVTELIFKDHVASVELVAREDSWWLFRNAARTVDP